MYLWWVRCRRAAVKGKRRWRQGCVAILYRETAIKHIWHRIAFIAFVSQTFFSFFRIHCAGCCCGSSKVCTVFLVVVRWRFFSFCSSVFIHILQYTCRFLNTVRVSFCKHAGPSVICLSEIGMCKAKRKMNPRPYISHSKRFNKNITNKKCLSFSYFGSIFDESHYNSASTIHFWHYNVCSP